MLMKIKECKHVWVLTTLLRIKNTNKNLQSTHTIMTVISATAQISSFKHSRTKISAETTKAPKGLVSTNLHHVIQCTMPMWYHSKWSLRCPACPSANAKFIIRGMSSCVICLFKSKSKFVVSIVSRQLPCSSLHRKDIAKHNLLSSGIPLSSLLESPCACATWCATFCSCAVCRPWRCCHWSGCPRRIAAALAPRRRFSPTDSSRLV